MTLIKVNQTSYIFVCKLCSFCAISAPNGIANKIMTNGFHELLHTLLTKQKVPPQTHADAISWASFAVSCWLWCSNKQSNVLKWFDSATETLMNGEVKLF